MNLRKSFSGVGAALLIASIGGLCKDMILTDVWGGEIRVPLMRVDNETITNTDVDNAIQLMIITGVLRSDESQNAHVRANVLEALIVEKIQLHSLKTLPIDHAKVQVRETDVQNMVQSIAKSNKMSVEAFEKMLGSPGVIKTYRAKLKSQLSFQTYMNLKHGHSIRASETEIDARLKDLENHRNQKEYHLQEITFMTDGKNTQKAHHNAQRVVEEARRGTSFTLLAQQMSQDAHAMRGGDIGWVTHAQMDPAVRNVVQRLSAGEISQPIRTTVGYKVVYLKDIRKAGEAAPGETRLGLCQAIVPLTPQMPQEDAEVFLPIVDKMMQAENCTAFEEQAQIHDFPVHTQDVLAEALDPQLRNLIDETSAGQCTKPILTDDGLIVTMVCSKKPGTYKLPKRDEVRGMLEQEKYAKLAQRELQMLRAKSYIEKNHASEQG